MSIWHVSLARDDARDHLSTLISASEMRLCWLSGGDDEIDGGATWRIGCYFIIVRIVGYDS